ncbi:hypothetical protein ACNTMW_29260 [Planosporangium sp. 12N6]|uniref:hypothetical protein n=1 Tax=Planosporangium spinosum TaxID=3402278 RepID=UPI003CF25BE4
MSLHRPLSLTWRCAGCGVPWPCPTRRGQLLAEYDRAPVSLALLMGGYFLDAAAELIGEPAGDLYDRFMGWIRYRPTPYGDQGP